jgi:hypothetical protein
MIIKKGQKRPKVFLLERYFPPVDKRGLGTHEVVGVFSQVVLAKRHLKLIIAGREFTKARGMPASTVYNIWLPGGTGYFIRKMMVDGCYIAKQ